MREIGWSLVCNPALERGERLVEVDLDVGMI
jgi:hypothetical protein